MLPKWWLMTRARGVGAQCCEQLSIAEMILHPHELVASL
jgi:hypothetical protein